MAACDRDVMQVVAGQPWHFATRSASSATKARAAQRRRLLLLAASRPAALPVERTYEAEPARDEYVHPCRPLALILGRFSRSRQSRLQAARLPGSGALYNS